MKSKITAETYLTTAKTKTVKTKMKTKKSPEQIPKMMKTSSRGKYVLISGGSPSS